MMADQDIELDLETGEEIRHKAPEPPAEETDDTTLPSAGSEDDEDDDHPGDDPGDGGGTDDEREAIRERRRQERRHRKAAQREREETLRRELQARDSVINELRGKVEAIERRGNSSELAQLDTAKKQTAQAYNYFKDQIRVATEAGNGAAVADATEKMLQAQRRFDELQAYEKAYRQRSATPSPLDPRLVNQAQDWMTRNRWFDPAAKDPDSRIAMTLDQALADEGWDPTTREYWQELDARVQKYLPHRATGGKMKSTKPRPTVAGAGRESGGADSGKTYRLSSDRVQALKDAGIWDDPKQRAEAIRRFREYDKQHRA
jgi:hypothetical protein